MVYNSHFKNRWSILNVRHFCTFGFQSNVINPSSAYSSSLGVMCGVTFACSDDAIQVKMLFLAEISEGETTPCHASQARAIGFYDQASA